MSHVDLCSGIGGFALGFEWAGLSKPVLFCDIEPWSRKVLAKHWPDVPIAHDVKELANDPARLVPDCDILTAGYPCQPFSVAGKQRGAEDDRHIWPQIFTIVQAKRPNWCVFENVSGHISLGLNQVLSDLEDKAGYAVQTFCIGAVSVNAPHRRQRIWIIANADNSRQSASSRRGKNCGNKSRHNAGRLRQNVGNAGCVTKRQSRGGLSEKRLNSGAQGQWSVEGHRLANTSENVADTSAGRCAFQKAEIQPRGNGAKYQSWWAVEPPVGRVAHGIPGRVDRLRGLGNAIVPQIAMQIGLTIKAVRDE